MFFCLFSFVINNIVFLQSQSSVTRVYKYIPMYKSVKELLRYFPQRFIFIVALEQKWGSAKTVGSDLWVL